MPDAPPLIVDHVLENGVKVWGFRGRPESSFPFEKIPSILRMGKVHQFCKYLEQYLDIWLLLPQKRMMTDEPRGGWVVDEIKTSATVSSAIGVIDVGDRLLGNLCELCLIGTRNRDTRYSHST